MRFKRRFKKSKKAGNSAETVMQKLDDAENIWRDATNEEYPLFSGIKINKELDPNQKMGPEQFWSFSIDQKGETMNTLIFDPVKVYEHFLKDVIPLFSKDKKSLEHFADVYGINTNGKQPSIEECVENLLLDTMVYLHFHELEHPMDAPYSAEDIAKIDVAIFEGIVKALPGVKKSEALTKAANARNLTLDMIDDNMFYSRMKDWTGEDLEDTLERCFKKRNRTLAGYDITKLPDGVITTWDVIEIKRGDKNLFALKDQDMLKSSAVFSLSRLPYVMMYVEDEKIREDELKLFVDHLKRMGLKDDSIEKRRNLLFKLMVKEQDAKDLAALGIDSKAYYQAVDIMLRDIKDKDYLNAKELVSKTIHELFTYVPTRYNAVSAYVMPFADLLSSKTSPGRGGTAGAGCAVDASSMLDNILDSMDPDEANQLLTELAQEAANNMCNNPSSIKKPGSGNKPNPGSSNGTSLSKKAFFEYYKKNSKKLEVQTPSSKMKTMDIGRDTYVERESSQVLGLEEVMQLDMNDISELQEELGDEYPVLVKLDDFTWELNDYKRIEDDVKVHKMISKGIDVPDNLVLIVDSSGSMGSNSYMGTGQKYDVLCTVTHGLLQGFQKAAEMTGTKANVKVINFSDGTYSSDFEQLDLAYKPGSKTMEMMHAFAGGGTTLNTDFIDEAEKIKKKGKTIYAVITDGGFTGGQLHDPNNAVKYFQNLLDNEGNALVFIEIQAKTTLGTKLEQLQATTNNLKYVSVDKVEDITKELGSVLIQYRK